MKTVEIKVKTFVNFRDAKQLKMITYGVRRSLPPEKGHKTHKTRLQRPIFESSLARWARNMASGATPFLGSWSENAGWLNYGPEGSVV